MQILIARSWMLGQIQQWTTYGCLLNSDSGCCTGEGSYKQMGQGVSKYLRNQGLSGKSINLASNAWSVS